MKNNKKIIMFIFMMIFGIIMFCIVNVYVVLSSINLFNLNIFVGDGSGIL